MKIVQMNVTYGNADSSGRNVKELHEYLQEHGYESYVFTTNVNDQIKHNKNIYLFSNTTDKRIHAVLSRITGRQGFFSRYTTKNLISKLNVIHPDIVMLHVLHSNCINFPLLFEYLATSNISTILVLHDSWYYTGQCCHYKYVSCNKWKEHCEHCSELHRWNKSWFFDKSFQNFKDKQSWYRKIKNLAIIGVSNWITNDSKQSILQHANIIQRIYNWVDLEIFKPQDVSEFKKELNLKPDEKILLAVASYWNEQKGLQEILQVAQALPNIKIIMIGKIPKNFICPDNILCIGVVKQPEILAKYYNLADLFLNPSVHETFGKTTAEALSCGTPAIVYNTTACVELVGKECGIVVNSMNKGNYVQTIINILPQTNRFSPSSIRSFALKNFNKKTNLLEYEKILKILISNKKGKQ